MLTILLVVVLVVLVGVYAVINHYYSKSNYVSDDKITINKSTEVETESTGLTDEETDALQSEILNETQDIELPNNSNVYNILLIGVDRRDKTWYGNSDSMILLSVNKDTKQIHMYLDEFRAKAAGANLIQAQRDCFGAHTYVQMTHTSIGALFSDTVG